MTPHLSSPRRRAAFASSVLVVALFVALLGPVGIAHAYTEGTRFDAPATDGGAGGRYFTGSPRDGYGCGVCHRGGAAIDPVVTGLPIDGWEPGQTYDLAIAFPPAAANAGAMLEIADDAGRALGTLAVLPDAELDPADRCSTGLGAMTLVSVPDRQVARASVCGAARARVRWTAPDTTAVEGRLFASVVAADASGDPSGDASITFARPLRARGAPPLEAGRLGQRCSVAFGRSSPPWLWLTLLVAALVAPRRRT
jgi:hypothetical protein